MYGHEPGAFTNATKKKRGKFELADKGVLFLDEIGDMSMNLQAKLLHALQTGHFAPIGAEHELKTDTWVIAATNHNLLESIEKKTFRSDLYYRLNIINIHIPPLRERPEDIRHLINHYLNIFSGQFGSKKLHIPGNQVINQLMTYHWPGNVRQLQNILQRLLLLGNNDMILNELFSGKSEYEQNGTPEKVNNPGRTAAQTGLFSILGHCEPDLSDFSLKDIRKKALDNIEREAISYVLSETEWNRTKAAKILKVSYKTLLTKISELNISPQ
jgi:transcriptional regulator with PAS, ATPase and Fis domain